MENIFTQFASGATDEKTDILTGLGIDWTLLVLQLIAFLILVWVLGKFVYPVFLRIIDARQDAIESGAKAAEEAKAKAEEAEKEVEKLMVQARKDAKDIVATARAEAATAIAAAEEKASARAAKIVDTAHEQIEKDVIAAKKALHNETIDLVALATEKVLQEKVDAKADKNLIAQVVKEAN